MKHKKTIAISNPFADGKRAQVLNEAQEEAFLMGWSSGSTYELGRQHKAEEMSIDLIQSAAGTALAGALLLGLMSIWNKVKERRKKSEADIDVDIVE